jgi:8-oxo-dGTP pyrophosphatase MutT (NUDIX family)/predicted DNA-binding transcriptional regulator AlpA
MRVMALDPTAEWWTTTDVAEYLGVRVATVSTYRKRGQMPAPDQSLGRSHVWRPSRIIAWHEGRPRPGTGGRPVHRTDVDESPPARVEQSGPNSPGISPSKWEVFGERVLYDNPWARLSKIDVQPPGGKRYESHVVTLPPAAMTAVLDDSGENVLLMWRHRFAVDLWNWELPGGVVDAGESPESTAVREVEEETGYRPRRIEHAVTFEPMVGQVRSPHHIFIGRGVERIGVPTERTEADRIEWKPLSEVPELIRRGQIANSGTLVALLYVLARISD